MENEVVIHVRAEDDTAAGFAKVRAKAKKLGEDIERELKEAGRRGGAGLADGISKGLDESQAGIFGKTSELGDGVGGILGDAGENAGKRLGDGIGDGFDVGAPDALSKVSTLGQDIADELGEAGRKGGEDFAKNLSDGMKSRGGGDGDDGLIPGAGKKGAKAGAAAGAGFVESFGNMIMGVAENPKVMGALGLVALSAAPIIGGALGAAVIGGAAGVGIVGGFAAAVQHPQVKGAGKALGEMIKDDLKSGTTSFVPAAVAAIDSVGAKWKQILPDLKSIFNQSTDLIDPLLDGILDGVGYIVDGIEKTIGDAGPVVEAFGEMFAEVGDALGDLFVNASDESDTFAAAIDFLSGVITTAIDAIGVFLEVSAVFIDFFRPMGGLIADAANALEEWWGALGETGEASEETAGQQEDLKGKVDDTTSSVQSQIEWMQALSDEMKKQTDPLFNLITAQQDVTAAQKNYNEALKKHGPRSEEAKDALVKLGKAATNMSGAAASAAKDGIGVVTPAMRKMWKEANLSKGQMDALEDALRNAKTAANNWEGTFTQTYIIEHKGQNTIGGSGYAGLATGGIAGAATGGMHSGLRWVGEAGPELVKLPAGTQVHSNADSQRLAGGGGSGMGGPTSGIPNAQMLIKFDTSQNSRLIRAIMEALRAEIRTEGGNVQTVLGVG